MINRRQLFLVILFFILWRLGLFAVGAVADSFLKYAPSFPYADDILLHSNLPRWLYSWGNFDGVHYLIISNKGYKGVAFEQVFFPLYPYILLHTTYQVTGGQINMLLPSLIFANFFAAVFAVIWFAFLQKKYNTRTAWTGLLLFFLFPLSFFLGAIYTESLFLLLVIGTFYAAEKKNWMLAGILTALASATRVVGIFLVPALLYELFAQQSKIPIYKIRFKNALPIITKFLQKNWRSISWILFGSVGLLAYMLYLGLGEFHDPLYFVHIQKDFGGIRESTLVLYPQVLWRSVKILLTFRPFDLRYFTYVQEFVIGFFGLIGILWASRYVKFSYTIFALLSFLLPTATGTFSSMPRYFLVCFSFFLCLANFLQKKPKFTLLWLSVSTILLVINTLLFIQGYWVA